MRNYFETWELVPWEIWTKLGENARNLVSGRLIHAMNLLRAQLGKTMTCNTRGPGGRDQSGLRVVGQSHYRPTSQHAGNHAHSLDGNRSTASDTIGDWNPKELHAMILKDRKKYEMIKFIEIDIGWLHIDVRDKPDIVVWSPKRGSVPVADYIAELKREGFWGTDG
ncbi:hypothetical protein [Vibrio phage JSF7]|uniref:Peptidase M15A C-terminal domain-containing protein n=1 Tax=Vibrio phage JSF7 TaxID=1292086 RepID=A0A240EWW0_9CAUD|nr:hypothetical protein HOQ92_gp28 [Vibrio phage JSF7]APD18152.1 hypothetical protein [Vibrio phage JSF7]